MCIQPCSLSSRFIKWTLRPIFLNNVSFDIHFIGIEHIPSKLQGLHKLKPIQGSGGSNFSQNNNGMQSNQAQMESSSSSASNLSLKNRVNVNPQQQAQLLYNGSTKNLQKSNSSPMSSFINNHHQKRINALKTASPLLKENGKHYYPAPFTINTYQSSQPYKDSVNGNSEKEKEPGQGNTATIADHLNLIFKSNSQKSINWEGTPQNQTHKSINNKNTGSQSHQSLLGAQTKPIIHNSSKKMLMPSGSSGTLLRKEIVEMDEVHSSRSSSIGKEDNANQASKASNRMKEVAKFNFTGKPFAPESIIVNNLERTNATGDLDERTKLKMQKSEQTQSQQEKPEKQITSKNYHTATNQDSQGSKPSQKTLKSSKQSGNSRKNLNNRNVSPQEQKFRLQTQISQKDQSNTQKLNLNLHLQPSNQSNLARSNMAHTQKSTKHQSNDFSQRKIHHKYTNPLTSKQSPQNQANINHQKYNQNTMQELNNMAAVFNSSQNEQSEFSKLSQTQKIKISFLEQSINSSNMNNTQSSKQEELQKGSQHASVKASQKPNKNFIQKSPNQQIAAKNARINTLQNNDVDQKTHYKKMNYPSQHSSNQVITTGSSNTQFQSKSPAEKMFESGLLQPNNINQSNTLAGKHQKLMTQDIYGLQSQIMTPSRYSINQPQRKYTGGSYSKYNYQLRQANAPYKNSQPYQERRKSGKSNNNSIKNLSQDLSNVSNNEEQQPNYHNSYLNCKINNNNGTLQSKNEEKKKIDTQEQKSQTLNVQQNPNSKSSKHYLIDLQSDHAANMYNATDSSRLSPGKTNKIPNSLAFKRNSNYQETIDEKIKSHTQAAGTCMKGSFKQNEDEEQLQTTRLPANTENAVFTLKDKPELRRNIPQANYMNFNNHSHDKRRTKFSLLHHKMDKEILIEIFHHLVIFLDFDSLMKLMSSNKDFREDFTKEPTSKQVYIFKEFKNQLRCILIQGLPSTLQRIQYWNFKTKFYYGKIKKPNLYKQLKSYQCDEIEATEIRKDVRRTFPDMKFFQKPAQGQKKLFNILNAVAKNKSTSGYIQGMNFLAGTILINLQKGEETFWMMMSILNHYKFDSILDLKKGGKFQILCYQLETFVKIYMPDLAAHFKKLKIPTDIYAANWFITMFCYELSLDLVFCILDVFLLEGIKSLIRISLALLKCLKDRLLKMNYEDCMVFLSHCQKEIELDSQTLMETAFQFKITKSLLLDLELFYKLKQKSQNPAVSKLLKAFTRLSLQEDDNYQTLNQKKYYWAILPATPDELKEAIKNDQSLSEDDIVRFYDQNIKHRKLREFVEEHYTDEDSEIANVNSYALEKKDIQNGKILQPSQRKKETLHSKYANSGLSSNLFAKRKNGQALHFSTDSNNTVLELNNEFSRGVKQMSKKTSSNAQNFSKEDQRFIQASAYKNNQLGQVVKPQEEVLITPKKAVKQSNDNIHSNHKPVSKEQSTTKKENESPFVQFGTKLKNIFGNFFRAQDKLNKSCEEQNYDQTYQQIPQQRLESSQRSFNDIPQSQQLHKQSRSKSIHHQANNSERQISPDVRITTQTYQSSHNDNTNIQMIESQNYQQFKNAQQFNKDNFKMRLKENEPQSHVVPIKIKEIQVQKEQIEKSDLMFYSTPPNASINNKFYQHTALSKDLKEFHVSSHQNKQISKSLEKNSAFSSSNPDDEDCDADVLSQFADDTIQTVSENIERKKNQSQFSKRPAILIAKDFVAGDEGEIDDNQNQQYKEINSFKVRRQAPFLKNQDSSQLS